MGVVKIVWVGGVRIVSYVYMRVYLHHGVDKG